MNYNNLKKHIVEDILINLYGKELIEQKREQFAKEYSLLHSVISWILSSVKRNNLVLDISVKSDNTYLEKREVFIDLFLKQKNDKQCSLENYKNKFLGMIYDKMFYYEKCMKIKLSDRIYFFVFTDKDKEFEK